MYILHNKGWMTMGIPVDVNHMSFYAEAQQVVSQERGMEHWYDKG